MKRKLSQMKQLKDSYNNEWKMLINSTLAKVPQSRDGMCIVLDGVNMGTTTALLNHNVSPDRIIVPENSQYVHDYHVKKWKGFDKTPILLKQCVVDTIKTLTTEKVCLVYIDLMGNSKTGIDTFIRCIDNLKNNMSTCSIIAVTFAARSRTGLTVADLSQMCLLACKNTFGNVQQGWSPFYKISTRSMGMVHFQFHINNMKLIEQTYSLCKSPVRIDINGSTILDEDPSMKDMINPMATYTLCRYAGFPNIQPGWHENDTLTFKGH